jgi:hypothetical protein
MQSTTSPKTQGGLSIHIPTDKLLAKAHEAQQTLEEHSRDVLELMGFSLLQMVLEAYEEKSLGKVGSDGIEWSPIQVRSLLARLRRVGQIGKLKDSDHKALAKEGKSATHLGASFRLNKSHAELDKTLVQLKRAGVIESRMKGKSVAKKGLIHGVGHVFGVVKHKKEGTTKETLRQTISPIAGGYQIGIDKGLQRQGLMPGKGGDQGPNLTTTEDTVTVGATMHYSKDFDKRRKIIPDVVPKKWIEDIEKQVAEYGAELFHKVFGEEQQ